MPSTPNYDSFNTAYLEASEGFSFAVSRDDPTLAVIMQEATQQIDDTLITNAMIRYSEARAPFSLVEVIRHYALPLLVIGLVIIAAIVIVFLRYRRQVNLFNKHQAAAQERRSKPRLMRPTTRAPPRRASFRT